MIRRWVEAALGGRIALTEREPAQKIRQIVAVPLDRRLERRCRRPYRVPPGAKWGSRRVRAGAG
jgi:hypothetical protein